MFIQLVKRDLEPRQKERDKDNLRSQTKAALIFFAQTALHKTRGECKNAFFTSGNKISGRKPSEKSRVDRNIKVDAARISRRLQTDVEERG